MENIALRAAETALVLIDLQHAIVGLNVSPYSGAQVVENSRRLAEAMRAKGGTVVYVRVLINEMLPVEADVVQRRAGDPPVPAIACEIVPEAGMREGDVAIAKRQWGAFEGTGLDQQLRRRGIKTIVMAGIATNIGVESTARAAFDLGYRLVFAEDAMSSMGEDMHRFAVEKIFPRMGHVRSADAVIAALA